MNNIVKLYGLNHSGSHYLAWLLHNNFPDMVILHSHTGWNHGKIVEEFQWDARKWNTDPYLNVEIQHHGKLLKEEKLNSGRPVTEYEHEIEVLYNKKTLPLLILIRNPYDWLRSYNIKHNPNNVPWKTLEKSCKLWSEINLNYINSDWPKKHIIKYEKLRDNTESQLDDIVEFLKLERNDIFRDTVADAVILSQADYQVGYENNNGIERCIKQHQIVFGLSETEFTKVFEENIDPKVLEFYNNL